MTTVSSGHWNCVIIHTTALTMTKPEYLYIIIVLKLLYIHFRYTTKMPMQVAHQPHPDTFQISDHKE